MIKQEFKDILPIALPPWLVSQFYHEDHKFYLGSGLSQLCSVESSLSLKLQRSELHCFLAIINIFQKKILFGPLNQFKIQFEALEVLQNLRGRSRRNKSLTRVLSFLPNIGLLDCNKEREIIKIKSLFSFESYRQESPLKGEYVFDLWNSSSELILGVVSSYREFSRILQGKNLEYKFLANKPSLLIPGSFWQDLTEQEGCLLLLLLEQLFLDTSSSSFLSLPLLFSLYRNKVLFVSGKNYNDFLLTLERVLKKLIWHGYLKEEKEISFFRSQENRSYIFPCQLKLSLSSSFFASQTKYFNWVHTFFLRETFLLEVQKTFLSMYPSFEAEHVTKRWLACLLSLDKDRNFHFDENSYQIINQNILLSYPVLFLEWSLRNLFDKEFPLPEELSQSELASNLLAKKSSSSEDLNKFKIFLKKVYLDKKITELIEKKELFSFSSWASLSSERYRSFKGPMSRNPSSLLDVQESSFNGGEEPFKEQKHETTVRTPLALKISSDKKLNFFKNNRASSLASLDLKSGELENEAQVKDLALRELTRMSKKARQDYLSLKKIFLDSLDLRSRRILMGLEKNMVQKTFEQHLEPRILQYMLENPTKWSSLEL